MGDLAKAAADFESHLAAGRDELGSAVKAKAKEAAAGTQLMVNARDAGQLWDGVRSTLMGLRDTAKALGDQEMSQVLHKAYIAVWKVR